MKLLKTNYKLAAIVMAAAARYDGLISETAFTHKIGSSTLQMSTWSYRYDGLKRLNTADHYPGTSGTMFFTDTERDIAYDRNGNITALKRYGSSGLVNDLSFTHTGNRMTSLVDANATGSDAGTKAFSYDDNGNMTSDGRKGLEMNWNLLNLADSAAMHGSSLTYAYLSDGSKTAARVSDGNGAAGERRYIGAFVFDGGDFESVAWDEGRIFADVPVAADSTAGVDSLARGYRDCWFAGDHLGNVRTVIDITPDLVVAEILEQNDYLPFGTKVRNSGQASFAANRWRYAGKEEQRFNWASASQTTSLDLSLLDFGARMYDPFTARWTAVDPMAGKYSATTPFNYCGNNPINLYDPDGEVAHVAVGIVVGAVVGAAIEGGIAAYHGKSKSEVLGAMAKGAIEGGAIAATVTTGGALSIAGSIARDVVIGAASSAAGSVAEQAISNESVNGKSVAKDAAVGAATGLVGGATSLGLKKASSSIIHTVETKYASSSARGKIRNEIKREIRNEGKKVSGKTINKMEKERVENHIEASKAFVNFAKGTVDYSIQKNTNSIVNERDFL